LQLKKMIGINGRLMAALIGQQHHLVGKWLMADHYIVHWIRHLTQMSGNPMALVDLIRELDIRHLHTAG